jgi:hypothetical protein
MAAAEPCLDECPPILILGAAIAQEQITILDLLDSLPWFKTAPDWTAWRSFLCAVYGLPMTEREADIYRACTGRKDPPTAQAKEVWVPTGRRARKTAIGALMGVWAGLHDWTPHMAPGERAVIPMMAKNKEDARTLRDFSVAILGSQALQGFMEGEPKAEEIHFVTKVDMRIRAVSLMAGRGRSVPLALLDEQAFWPTDDSAVPDVEVIDGIRPAMANMPGSILVGLSSPYARRGVLWQRYKECFGQDGPILVWQAPTLRMHDTPQIRGFVEAAYRDDPVSAAAEYGAEFRTDVGALVPLEVVEACVVPGRAQLQPVPGTSYVAFADPSGGSSDSMTLAIAHWAGISRCVVVDYVREWPAPFDPDTVVEDQAQALKAYGLTSCFGDKYAGEWPAARYRANGIRYRPASHTKSETYLNFLPMLTGSTVELLDQPRVVAQLASLERRTARGGKDSIDHPPGSHDDMANVVAGVSVEASRAWNQNVKQEMNPNRSTIDEFRDKVAALSAPPRAPSRNAYRRPR